MVGVPHSKGCKTCLRRRVKCDETRPNCSQCLKGGRKCPGYNKTLVFKFENPGSTPSHEDNVQAPKTALHESLATADSSSTSSKTTDSSSSSEIADPKDSDQSWQMEVHQAKQSVADLFSPALQESQLLYLFTCAISPPRRMMSDQRYHGIWLTHTQRLLGASPTLDLAVRSATCAYFSIRTGNVEMSHTSRRLYGLALRSLRHSLSVKSLGLSSEIQCATMLLSFYELFSCTKKDSWIRHAGGAGELMRVRGPECCRTGFDRDMYLAFRGAIIMQAWQSRTACFFDEPEWRALTTSLQPQTSDPLDIDYISGEMINVMAAGPRILKDLIQAEKKDDHKMISDVLNRTLSFRERLNSTFALVIESLTSTGDLPWEEPSPTGNVLVPVIHRYANFFTPLILGSFWSNQLAANLILGSTGYSDRQSLMAERMAIVIDICKSTEHLASAGFLGAFHLVNMLSTAYEAATPIYRDWIKEQLALVSTTLKIASYATDS